MRVMAPDIALRQASVDANGWISFAKSMAAQSSRLLALWGHDTGTGIDVRACWLGAAGLDLACLLLAPGAQQYPGLHELFPAAARMQRGLRDMLGVHAIGMDARPWLRHDAWPDGWYPLRIDAGSVPTVDGVAAPYPFVAVDGEGVHEIPVGPVHAGVIEPGQFRFSVIGEKVLRLEQRLGFTHKGLARRLRGMSAVEGRKLAARASGDNAVALSWAYCRALEALAGVDPPPRGVHLRALLLERERLANHLGDLGAIANDAGFGFALAQFSRLKEDLLRRNAQVFGARYPMDVVQPGGVCVDLDVAARDMLRHQGGVLASELARLRDIVDQHEGVQDRFRTTGRVPADLASRLGMLGLVARASGQAGDLRALPTWAPYASLGVRVAASSDGDVAARVSVRFDEAEESLRLCRLLLDGLPPGPVSGPWPAHVAPGLALGLVEGWRGPTLVALQLGADACIVSCHLHDVSWQNWPALEWAVINDIVPDFPLINKSFNLSYSGHDL